MSHRITALKTHWKFTRTDDADSMAVGHDDSAWETVRVPHDWAISGPFDRENDIQRIVRKQADVEVGVTEITGRTGGLPHVGVGWYRKVVNVPADTAGKRVRLEIDGAMSRSRVYCNGTLVGEWPYGYSSFAFDLTDLINPGEDNLIAVRLENKPDSSRWYPGAGLYRNVRLVTLDSVHVAHWGTTVTTPEVSSESATVNLRTAVENHGEATEVNVRSIIKDADGSVVASDEAGQVVDGGGVFEQTFSISRPKLWMPGEPNLYAITTEVVVDGAVVDVYETPLGFRTLTFDPDKGFYINGTSMKMNGVCMHHDLGPLGAAVNRTALKRQLEILQDMGCNAIRTSHNPPTPELLELCDQMGFLLIDEAFDEWAAGKVENGYHGFFREWAEKDLRAMIRRDRNHPCVIMWSIGNEIIEQWQEDGAKVAQYLCDICHDEDPTRPTTAGFNGPDQAIENGLADVVDIPGWNYHPQNYVRFHKRFPEKATYGSETESTVSSRGEYYFPVSEDVSPIRESLQVSSYDMAYPGWAYSPDVEFRAQDECDFSLGEFVWTGFDYIGEPTPYSEEWPSRSSYFGIIDLCGIPKDRFYLYQSKWTDKQVLHLLPHWTWPGREGECTPVHCYTSFNTVELFLNGESLGRRSKRAKLMMGTYRLVWPDVRYAPGELKAVAYDNEGQPAAETVVKTAGQPAAIELTLDRNSIVADGDDMAFATVRILDAQGTLCPTADNLVTFRVEGPAEIAAVGNGNAISLEPFQADHRKAFNGMCVVYLRSVKDGSGTITLHATAEGLKKTEILIKSQKEDG
jgi:beta-galactosidase